MSSPAAARSAIESRWLSTWSIAAASPNCRSVSISAGASVRATGERHGEVGGDHRGPGPALAGEHDDHCRAAARRSPWARGRRGAAVSARRVASRRAATAAGRPRRRRGSPRAAPRRRRPHRRLPPVQLPARAGVVRTVMSSTRVAGDTDSRCAAKSAAGGSAKRLVEEEHIGLAQPRFLDDRGRLVGDAADVDDVVVRARASRGRRRFARSRPR